MFRENQYKRHSSRLQVVGNPAVNYLKIIFTTKKPYLRGFKPFPRKYGIFNVYGLDGSRTQYEVL